MNPKNIEIDWLLKEKYGGKETANFWRDVERLKRGEHISYVIGFVNFLGVKVDISTRPLIPRPETEYWVEKVIEEMLDSRLFTLDEVEGRGNDKVQVLDVFCGSGCVGLAVLKHVPGARVDFADIESKYFAGIRRSLRWNKISAGRARFFKSDILKNRALGHYDYILANPPYIPARGRRVAKSVLKQEPRAALFAGPDGLKYIRALMRAARAHLAPRGILVLEFDPPQKNQIGAIARRFGYRIQFSKDQYGRFRCALLTLKI